MLRRVVCVIVSLVLVCALCFSSEGGYHFMHIDKQHGGLSYDGVKTMMEDSRGYVWIGTFDGLCRYDGTRLRNYGCAELGTTSSYVTAIEEDGNGDIWIGTDDGVVMYRYSTDSFVKLEGDSLPHGRVFCLRRSPDGKVWVGFRNFGLFHSTPEGVERYPLYDSAQREILNVYRIAFTDDSRMFIAEYCRDVYSVNGSGAFSIGGEFFLDDDVEGLSTDSSGKIWIASKRHGLCSFDSRRGVVRSLLRPSDSRPVNVNSDDVNVWFCTTAGLYRYNQATEHSEIISTDHVTYAFTDRSGSLWVSTESSGVYYSNVFGWRFAKYYRLDSGESISGCRVQCFARNSDGALWIGTRARGLLRLDGGRLSEYDCAALPSEIGALCQDGDYLWIGYFNGLCRLNVKTRQVRNYNCSLGGKEDADNRVISLFLAKDGTLFAGTNVGVGRYDRLSDTFEPVRPLAGVTVENMAQEPSGLIWMASYSQGVYAYNPKTDSLEETFCSREGDSIIPEMTSSVTVDPDGVPWVMGFSTGFYVRDGKDFRQYSRKTLNQLPTDVFYTGIFDSMGNLWMTTDSGLVEFNPRTEYIRLYTVSDGLLSNKFIKGGLRLNDSALVFGTDDGFVIFDPETVVGGPRSFNASISMLSVNGKPWSDGKTNVDLADGIVLEPSERNLNICFAVPGSADKSANMIFCRLDPYEEEWRNVSAVRAAAYFNIPKGKYTLRVATPLPDGSMKPVHKDLSIEVLPRFFESWKGVLCIALGALLIAALVFSYIFRNLITNLQRRHSAKEKALQDELYHEKMNFFANVIHEIKTPLTLIRTPLQNLMVTAGSSDRMEDLELISNSTDYLSKLVKELLEFISLEESGYVMELRNIDLVDRIGFITSNYTEAAKNRNLKLNYNHDCEHLECAVDGKALSKIVNNLLGNAIKYAESYLEVELATREGCVLIFFRNDGESIPEERRKEIFKPFVYYDNPDQSVQSFGIGLPLARKLSTLHGGSLTLSERTDCVEFVLSLPLRKADESVLEDSAPRTEDVVNPGKPLLLIVEDNADLLGYLKRKLSSDYVVVGVQTAEAAIEKLSRLKADLLITDLGLHSMSGVELCARVSSNPQTAHIPIIVLSAISLLKTKIKCMENGAVMYIEKPFSLDYLVSCINSVLQKRKSIKSSLTPSENLSDRIKASLPDRDEDFISRIDSLIERSISDPDFTNTQLEAAMFVSHSSLNRKMKALLNTTPNAYIRKKRLDLAAQMLQRGGARINEICYAVGFSSPSYFSKCFKKQFGKLPAEYARED